MYSLRKMVITDLVACRAIVEAHWGEVMADQARNEMLEMFNPHVRWPPHYIVAEDETGIIGFAGYKSAWFMSNSWELVWINVRSDRQGIGVGQSLTDARMTDIFDRGGTLVILMTQKPGFFEQFQFKVVDKYENGWCLMVRQLAPIELAMDKSG